MTVDGGMWKRGKSAMKGWKTTKPWPLQLVLPLLALAQPGRACDEVLDDVTGTIKSPGFPGNYPTNMDCTYRIKVGMT